MKISILPSPPISGSIREVHLEATGGDCTWFLLESDKLTAAIVANNGGVLGLNSLAAIFSSKTHAMLLARGQGFIISIPQIELVHKTKVDYFVNVLPVRARDLVIASSSSRVCAFNLGGLAWQIDNFPGYDIEMLSVEVDRVICRGWGGTAWWNFSIMIDTQEIVRR